MKGHLHLHRFEGQQARSLLDDIALGDRHVDNDRRRPRLDHTAVRVLDRVPSTVDLDRDARATVAVHDAPTAAGVVEHRSVIAGREQTERIEGPIEPDQVAIVAQREHVERSCPTAQAELAGQTARLGDALGNPISRFGEEALFLAVSLALVVDHRGHKQRFEGQRGVAQAVPGDEAIEPCRVGVSLANGLVTNQVDQQRLVGRSVFDDQLQLAEGALEAGESDLTAGPPADQLGDHRVELGGDRLPLDDTAVDADTGTRGRPKHGDDAGAGLKVSLGVLGVDADLDGVAARRRVGRVPVQPPGDVELGLDEVAAHDHLGDRVLDLEPGVHLEKAGFGHVWLEEELGRTHAAIARRFDETGRRLAEPALELGRQDG